MRILLIEDDMLIGDGIKTGLSKMGFSVDWFTQGREKRRYISAPYDAVITDLTLLRHGWSRYFARMARKRSA